MFNPADMGWVLITLAVRAFGVHITARHKAEAEAQGIEYVSPEELAAQEQAEQDRIAEESRIQELKTRCEKKGLSFAEEEAKYQAKLAAVKAKEEAKKAKKHRN